MSAYAGSFPVVVTQVPQHIAASNSQQVYSSGTDAVSNPNPSAMATPMVYAAGAPGPFPQAAVGSPSGAGSEQGGEEIRTLFVTGFPPDVQMRELHTLLRFFPGYEASQMSTKQGPAATAPQGFALFSNQALARQAMARINDLAFDHEHHLRVELAHKNMYLKEDPSIYKADRPTVPVPAVAPAAGMPNGAPYAVHNMGQSGPLLSTLAALRPAMPLGGFASATPMAAAPLGGFAPVTNRFDNAPCNTLFIGNLGDSVDEEELQMLFGSQPGFKQLKLIRNPRQVSCFVEYGDVATAAAVHTSLQGAILASSDRGPIRVQYSKNPFGRRSNPTGGMMPGAAFLAGPGAATGLMPDFAAWPGAFNVNTLHTM